MRSPKPRSSAWRIRILGLDFSASAEIGIRKALATPRMKDVKKRFFIESGFQVNLLTGVRVNKKRHDGLGELVNNLPDEENLIDIY